MIHKGMTRAAYDRLPGLNWSRLSRIAKSPKYAAYQPPEREDTPAMRIGRLVHLAFLEPERFTEEVVVFEGRRAGAKWDAFHNEHEDHEICTEPEFDQIIGMAGALEVHAGLDDLVRAGDAEVSASVTDPVYGMLKGRMDCYAPGIGILDLKTTRGSVSPRAFARSCLQWNYHGQLAYYQRLAEDPSLPLYILAVETSAPYEVASYRLSDDVVALGHELVDSLLARWKHCQETGLWLDEHPEVQELTFPAWAYGDDDADALEGVE